MWCNTCYDKAFVCGKRDGLSLKGQFSRYVQCVGDSMTPKKMGGVALSFAAVAGCFMLGASIVDYIKMRNEKLHQAQDALIEGPVGAYKILSEKDASGNIRDVRAVVLNASQTLPAVGENGEPARQVLAQFYTFDLKVSPEGGFTARYDCITPTVGDQLGLSATSDELVYRTESGLHVDRVKYSMIDGRLWTCTLKRDENSRSVVFPIETVVSRELNTNGAPVGGAPSAQFEIMNIKDQEKPEVGEVDGSQLAEPAAPVPAASVARPQ